MVSWNNRILRENTFSRDKNISKDSNHTLLRNVVNTRYYRLNQMLRRIQLKR